MMKKNGPILLLWSAVALSILTLLAKLRIFHEEYLFVFSILSMLTFVIAAYWCWTTFKHMSLDIRARIIHWDEDLRKDIPVFLEARKVRLLTMFGLVSFLYLFELFTSKPSVVPAIREVSSYVLIIGLFHCCLVTSLIMFKIFKTWSWVDYENQLAKTEEA